MKKSKQQNWFDIYSQNEEITSIHFDNDDENGRLETFGEDLELVKKIYNETPLKVWTVIHNDDAIEEKLLVVNGYFRVNRAFYLISNEDCKQEDLQKEFLF